MYRIPYSASLLLAFSILSYAKHTVFIDKNGAHSYITKSEEPDVCMKPKCIIEASDILTSLDQSVDPCDDFHRFACGGWLKRQEVSEDEPQINTMSQMQKDLNRKLRDLLESKYKSSDPPFVKMLKDFYNTCMDLNGIEKKGSEPLKKMLSRLGGWPVIEGSKWDESEFDWVDTLLSFRKYGYDQNILMRVDVAPKSPNETIQLLRLGWPYRFLPYDSNVTLGLDDTTISDYYKTMIKAAKLLGADETIAEEELLKVVNFMIDLENSVKKPEDESEETNSTTSSYEYTVKDLLEEVPQIPWKKYLSGILKTVVYENDTIDVEHTMHFFTKIADLLISTEKRVIANYLMMQAVFESAQYLSEEWVDIYEEMNGGSGGRTVPRWKRCLSSLMGGMQIALSSYYVRNYFRDESKDEAMILMKYIHKEFLNILEQNDWMDDETRKKAEEKANALKSYIGYPNELLNDTFVMSVYENLTISAGNHLENILAFEKMDFDERLSFFRKSQDLKEVTKFLFIVQVNAYYNPYGNVIGIPAGILHDAFYDKDRPNYMNFGAIGYVIGHEITHGFDNKGRYFDKDGNQVNWWDKKSDEHYVKKVQCIIDQYDNYTTDIGLNVNGKLTQNENIADNGGLKEAYWAYQAWSKDNGIEPTLPALNYTQNQLFWLSAAHVWCSKIEPERLKMKLMGDPHSPDRFRIIGPMSNLEEFSKDFKCSADSPMNRKYKCKVW